MKNKRIKPLGTTEGNSGVGARRSPEIEPGYTLVADWLTQQPGEDTPFQLIMSAPACANMSAIQHMKPHFAVGGGWHYEGHEEVACEIFPSIYQYADQIPTHRSGAFRFHFGQPDGRRFSVLMVATLHHDADGGIIVRCLARVPAAHVESWLAFNKEMKRIDASALPYRGKVYVIGGNENTFDTNISLNDVYLPQALKDEIIFDIDAFYARGVSIYQRLNIRPFRKLLLAGVPGTGKTMLCSAIANWALEKGMFVVYVSGSSSIFGARFWKVFQALDLAASSEARTIVIVEELDAFMNDDESKAELLNVLDGMESPTNPFGTVLISTTNHPERIDERVMKRPGRLDRVFIIPEMEDRESTEHMLRSYMGEHWEDEHRALIGQLLGKPGAFIREVALYALTRAAYRNEERVTLESLQHSLELLNQQIEAKDDFLTANRRRIVGFSSILSGG
jgi:hypothetical protein